MLHAKVLALLRSRQLREYYQRRLRLEPTTVYMSDADHAFLEQAMYVAEEHLTNPTLGVGMLTDLASVLYRRLKAITGHTTVEFICDMSLKWVT